MDFKVVELYYYRWSIKLVCILWLLIEEALQ